LNEGAKPFGKFDESKVRYGLLQHRRKNMLALKLGAVVACLYIVIGLL
jgi:hypothetical protein